ncbi:major capsid protein [Achromobacter sp. PAB15]|uniref:major capsid protein n=1 Tax=Achromobacter sp. PAB15 TaxID=3233048 RepID=UPI003F92246B
MSFDLVVFNKQVATTITELVDQEVNKFNEASGGVLVLASAQNKGDFSIESMFKQIGGLVRRRDAYGSGSVPPKRLEQMANTAVKVAAGTPPIEFEPQQYLWIYENPTLAALKIGEQLAKAKLQDMLNAVIRALVAALKGNVGVVHEVMDVAPTWRVLNQGAGKFGDRSGALAAWILHSTVLTNLYDNALSNAERLFTYGTVNVMRDPFGRIFVVTDADPLVNPGAWGDSPLTYDTLGLVPGAGLVQDNGDFNAVMVDKTGGENISRVYQAEWTYNVGISGYSWDQSNGGKSPNDMALGSSANWDKTASSNKDTAGILIVTK